MTINRALATIVATLLTFALTSCDGSKLTDNQKPGFEQDQLDDTSSDASSDQRTPPRGSPDRRSHRDGGRPGHHAHAGHGRDRRRRRRRPRPRSLRRRGQALRLPLREQRGLSLRVLYRELRRRPLLTGMHRGLSRWLGVQGHLGLRRGHRLPLHPARRGALPALRRPRRLRRGGTLPLHRRPDGLHRRVRLRRGVPGPLPVRPPGPRGGSLRLHPRLRLLRLPPRRRRKSARLRALES